MIPAIAKKWPRASAGSMSFDWVSIHDPGGYIQRMDVLLRDYVPGENLIDAPGSQPRLAIVRVFAQLLIALFKHQISLVLGVNRNQFSNIPFVDSPNHFLVSRHRPGLKIYLKNQLL